MVSPSKIGIALLTLGSAGVATYGGITYFSTKDKEIPKQGKSIQSLIDEKFEYILLDFTAGTGNKNETIWTQKWNTYKQDNNGKAKDILGISNWNKDAPSTSSEELKKKCKELSELVVYDEGKANYDNVTKYCGKEATAEDEAIKNRLEIIKGDGTDPWKDKIAKKSKLTKHLTKLNILDNDWSTPATIKQKCETAKAKPRKSEGYESFYEAYKLVCTSHTIPE